MKAYSLDLRERIMAAVDAGQPRKVVAALFQVAQGTISQWCRLRAETGGLAPRPRVGDQPEIRPAQHPALVAQLTAAPDATLADHCATWAAATGQTVSVATMWRAIDRVGWTYKKNGGRR